MVKGLKTLGATHDNSFIIQKIALRLWLLEYFENPRLLDLYGGYGKMFQQVWGKYIIDYTAGEGDALKYLKNHTLDYDIYDIDPWGSSWEALDIINSKSKIVRIGVVCTDGALKRAGQIRSSIPKILVEVIGLDKGSRALKAEIFYHYPVACRMALNAIFNRYTIKNLAVKEHKGMGGSCGTVYFAAILVLK